MHQKLNIKQKVAEIALSYSTHVPTEQRVTITEPAAAAKIFRGIWEPETFELMESFKLMLLNRSNQVLGIVKLSQGGITGTIVDVRLIYGIALKSVATAIILCHNHPSGRLVPSDADKQLTKQVCKAGAILDIPVLDHIILTKEGYFSFAGQGLLPAQTFTHSYLKEINL